MGAAVSSSSLSLLASVHIGAQSLLTTVAKKRVSAANVMFVFHIT